MGSFLRMPQIGFGQNLPAIFWVPQKIGIFVHRGQSEKTTSPGVLAMAQAGYLNKSHYSGHLR
jgi:hypothetical protein